MNKITSSKEAGPKVTPSKSPSPTDRIKQIVLCILSACVVSLSQQLGKMQGGEKEGKLWLSGSALVATNLAYQKQGLEGAIASALGIIFALYMSSLRIGFVE